jgi:hypothetical protein
MIYIENTTVRTEKSADYLGNAGRTLSPMAKTSSASEVVGDLLVCAFAKEHGDEMPQRIRMTSKSV